MVAVCKRLECHVFRMVSMECVHCCSCALFDPHRRRQTLFIRTVHTAYETVQAERAAEASAT